MASNSKFLHLSRKVKKVGSITNFLNLREIKLLWMHTGHHKQQMSVLPVQRCRNPIPFKTPKLESR